MPALPVSAHDWQVPVQALAQQTPCAQKPESHSDAAAQVVPMGFFVQSLPMQKYDEAQSASVAQPVLQAPPAVSHPYSSQEDVVAGAQVPVPVQVRGVV